MGDGGSRYGYPGLAVVARRVGPRAVRCRKRPGNASTSTGAHRCAALSQEKIGIPPCKDPARGRIQSVRVTAQVFTRVSSRRKSDFSPRTPTSWAVPRLGKVSCRKRCRLWSLPGRQSVGSAPGFAGEAPAHPGISGKIRFRRPAADLCARPDMPSLRWIRTRTAYSFSPPRRW